MAEGKEHALAIGYTKMSAQDMYVCFTMSLSELSCLWLRQLHVNLTLIFDYK